jgi:hypothetical protein
MPDDDRFPRYLTPAWKRVRHSLERHDPLDRVTYLVARALADTVRTVRGVPALAELASHMQQAAATGGTVPRSAAGRRHVPTDIAEQAAAALAATMQHDLALVSPAEAALMLARRVLSGLAYHYGFDRMVTYLLYHHYQPGDLRQLMTAMLDSEPAGVLARRFAARPTGKGLQAPGRRRRQMPQAELLHADLDALQ